MTVSREEVARAAIKLEDDGRAFYLDVADKASTELVAKMFRSLADDELDHKRWIEEHVPGVDSSAEANKRLYERLRHIFADVPEQTLRTLAGSESDVHAIHAGRDVEKKSIDAYETWADEADDEEIENLCRLLAGIERFHLQVLDNTLEYFERTPDWFMREEQWNFEGGNV
ncbi:MAG: ferritin-like domain-containing protein [Planctomycetota bacterium]